MRARIKIASFEKKEYQATLARVLRTLSQKAAKADKMGVAATSSFAIADILKTLSYISVDPTNF